MIILIRNYIIGKIENDISIIINSINFVMSKSTFPSTITNLQY